MAARRLVKETWNSLEAKESLGTEYSMRVKGRDKEDTGDGRHGGRITTAQGARAADMVNCWYLDDVGGEGINGSARVRKHGKACRHASHVDQ